MPALDPDAQVILEAVAAAGEPHLSTLSVEEARQRVRAALVAKGAPLPLHSVEDTECPTPNGPRRVRIYRPREGTLPVALFLHGGGWTVNDVDTHDELCRRLAKRSGWALASLEYRRAPEHRHPAQLEDAHAAFGWLRENAASFGCDPESVALVGESSGGSIAASLSVMLRDRGEPLPTYQVLAYPVADRFDRWPSYRERGERYILDRELMRWYFGHFMPEEEAPYLVPLETEDLSGLPKTLILTAEFDPLRDEGVEYAKRLRDAGVDIEHVHAADQMHGFLLLGRVVPKCAALIERTADALARARPA